MKDENSQLIFERRSRTRSLSTLPSTVLPSRAALAVFTTAPICLMEFAPDSAMALAMAASISASLAPAGKHVINIFGGHAPYKLKDGASWADEKRNLTKAVLDVIDEMAPGFSGQVIEAETLVAPDLEAIVGLPQGHIFHGELSADQLFWQRPAPHWADYRTPITGLYQCGSSTHPGGGVSGIPGHNAAREIAKDWKRLQAPRAL